MQSELSKYLLAQCAAVESEVAEAFDVFTDAADRVAAFEEFRTVVTRGSKIMQLLRDLMNFESIGSSDVSPRRKINALLRLSAIQSDLPADSNRIGSEILKILYEQDLADEAAAESLK